MFKPVDEGGVLYSTTDDVYFAINGVGARIWELLPPVTRTFGELCDELAKIYSDVDLSRIRTDARKYVQELLASGLVVPVEDGRSPDASQSDTQRGRVD